MESLCSQKLDLMKFSEMESFYFQKLKFSQDLEKNFKFSILENWMLVLWTENTINLILFKATLWKFLYVIIICILFAQFPTKKIIKV